MNELRKGNGKSNIYLIGFMGTGKSTVAKALSDRGLCRIEMDDAIAARAGMSIPEIFERFGEAHFRSLETEFLRELQGQSGAVISCGGGAAMRAENVEMMKRNGWVVLLAASSETVYGRIKGKENRPVLKGRMNVEAIRELMEARRSQYEAAAELTIWVDGKSPREIAGEILGSLENS